MTYTNCLELLLSEKDSYDYFYLILKPFTNGRALRQNQHILSPLRSERTPSFCIYQSKTEKNDKNRWRYKDFGTDNEQGSFLDLAIKIYGVNYEEATKILLGMIDAPMPNIPEKLRRPATGTHEIVTRVWDEWKDEAYWGNYGITIETLNKFGVRPVCAVISKYGNDVVTEVMNDQAYLYDVGGYKKVYRPGNDTKKFRYFGKGKDNYMFGYRQLPAKGEAIILTGGEKDVMTLHSLGYNAICLNSETVAPTQELIKELHQRFETIYVLYDNDKTGRKQSLKVAEEFGFTELKLPDSLGWGKDISDYWKYFKKDPVVDLLP